MNYYLLFILAFSLTRYALPASFNLIPLATKPLYAIASHDKKYIFYHYQQNEAHGTKTVQFTCQDTASKKIIGLIELHQKTTQLTIERIYIHRDFRSKGIGSCLLLTALHYGALSGKSSITGDIWPLDEDADDIQALKKGQEKLITFYQRAGACIITQKPYTCYPGLTHYSFIFNLYTYKK